MIRYLLASALTAGLAACTTTTPALSSFIAAESLDTAALAGLVAYEALPGAKASVVAQAKVYQIQVDAAFAPLEAQAEAGQTIGDDSLALAALQTLVSYEESNGISITTKGN